MNTNGQRRVVMSLRRQFSGAFLSVARATTASTSHSNPSDERGVEMVTAHLISGLSGRTSDAHSNPWDEKSEVEVDTAHLVLEVLQASDATSVQGKLFESTLHSTRQRLSEKKIVLNCSVLNK